MGSLRVLIFACLIAFGAAPACGQGQVPQAQQVEAIWEAYKQLDYEQVESKAHAALASFEGFNTQQLTQIHAVLGLVKFAQNDSEAARQQFEAALSLTPALRLDPRLVSPKVITFFERVRQELQKEEAVSEEPASPPVRYILVEDPRPAAALRSAALPGWGQLYKKEQRKGRLLVGLWSTTLSGAAVAHLVRAQAKEAYQDARDPEVIEERYGTYNGWHKVRTAFLFGAGLVWVYSYYDALLSWDPPYAISSLRQNLQIVPTPAPPYAHLRLQLQF